MAAVFLTGFSTLTGDRLVGRLLKHYPPEAPVYCLVQVALRRQAEKRLAEIERAHPAQRGRIRLLEGAVTLPDLGLGSGYGRINSAITAIYHLAAGAEHRHERDLSTKVTLIGAQNILSFAERCPHLTRLHYISSCRVSGQYAGVFTENDLDKGQSFMNYHEETLFLAENEVQRSARAGLSVTIYRPGWVTGDSQSGMIQPEDALFDLLYWLLRHSSVDVMALTGNPFRNRAHLVPCDYVAAAVAYLSGLDRPAGRVYHLLEPNPLRLGDFSRTLGMVTGRRIRRIWAPLSLARMLLQTDPALFRYFHQPTRYTTTQAQADLQGSGIVCPQFASYAGRLVEFILANQQAFG